MKKIVLASNNPGKLRELKKMLAHLDLEVMSQSEFDVPDIEETGLTFVENAILKARNACRHTHLPAIADDSGLEVDVLNGRPGIYSARYAGVNPTAKEYCSRLLNELKEAPKEKRMARFQSAIVFMRHAEDPSPLIGRGAWEGVILEKAMGTHGFGYDPVFYVPELKCSAAELAPEIKNQHSHRARALKDLLRQMEENK